MTGKTLVTGFSHILFVMVVVLMLVEPAFANKFQTIGGGVGGVSREKLAILKEVSLYAGLFLVLLGVLSLFTRKRYEGLIGIYKGKSSDVVVVVPVILIVLGILLVVIHLV
jgi:hypothetical protein